MAFTQQDIQKIKETSYNVKQYMINKYGPTNDNMMGKCIEASDTLVLKLKQSGFNAEAKQVWCLYENFESCTVYCYEEHWVVKVTKGKDKLFIDLTINQFQWAFSKELPQIYFDNKLPNFLLTRKPGEKTFDKCGWTDWLMYGDYENNFDYYE